MNLEIISSLEKKIDSLIEYCNSLREEKKKLEEMLSKVRDENSQLTMQLSTLEEERKAIGDRVERMLQRIEAMENIPGQAEVPLEE